MPWSEVIRQLLKKELAMACFVVMCLFVLVAILAQVIVPAEEMTPRAGETSLDEVTGLERSYHPPGWILWLQPDNPHFNKTGQNPKTKEDNPPLAEDKRRWGFFDARTWHLPLGCNIHGVPVLGSIIRGTQLAFLIGLIPTLISSIIAVIVGLIAGYYGKWIDDIVTYILTTITSIPFVLLLIAFIQAVRDSEFINKTFEDVKLFGLDEKPFRNLLLVLIVIGVTSWIGLCRLIRAEVIKHKNREYVQAARALGCGQMRIIFKHILPNVMHLVIITFTLAFVGAVELEVFLSYVGIGIDPTLHTWGQLIVGGRNELQRDPSVWWPLVSATVALFLLSLSFSLFGDALRDALDPKLRT